MAALVIRTLFVVSFIFVNVNCSSFSQNWINLYKQIWSESLTPKLSPFEKELKVCLEKNSCLNPELSSYLNITESPTSTCCQLFKLRDCLKSVAVKNSLQNEQAIVFASVMTTIWSSNNITLCEKGLTKGSTACILYYNKETLWTIGSILGVTIAGIPLAIFFIKKGLFSYCLHRSNFSRLESIYSTVQEVAENRST